MRDTRHDPANGLLTSKDIRSPHLSSLISPHFTFVIKCNQFAARITFAMLAASVQYMKSIQISMTGKFLVRVSMMVSRNVLKSVSAQMEANAASNGLANNTG